LDEEAAILGTVGVAAAVTLGMIVTTAHRAGLEKPAPVRRVGDALRD
jgi:hypothetical protein